MPRLSSGLEIVRESFSPSEGVAIIENQTTGQKATQKIQAPKPEATLGGQNAEWIVEDFQNGDSVVPFADFGEITFTGCEARAQNGDVVGLNGAKIIELKQDGKIKTEVTVHGEKTLSVKSKL